MGESRIQLPRTWSAGHTGRQIHATFTRLMFNRDKWLALQTRMRTNLLARNTAWMFAGQSLRLIVQATYFVIIARSLGADGYGSFAGIAAFVALIAPFSGLGSGSLMIKHVARDPDRFAAAWGHALVLTGISGTALFVLVLGLAQTPLLPTVPILLVITIALAELFCSRIVDLSAQAFQAFQHLQWTAQLRVMLHSLLLVAALIMPVAISAPTPVQWGVLYLIATLCGAIASVWLVQRRLGRPTLAVVTNAAQLREGFYFSVSLAAHNAYNDIDKAMLARLSTLQAVGIYAVAYRIIDIAFGPVRALLDASYTQYFQHGMGGIRGSLALTKRLLPIAGLYSLLAGGTLFVLAPLLPAVFGNDYRTAAEALRWLAILPPLKVVHCIAADTLTGADFQGRRTIVQTTIAIFNLAVNVILIPRYSWLGAAWASILSDLLLALVLGGMVWYMAHHTPVVPHGQTTSPTNSS